GNDIPHSAESLQERRGLHAGGQVIPNATLCGALDLIAVIATFQPRLDSREQRSEAVSIHSRGEQLTGRLIIERRSSSLEARRHDALPERSRPGSPLTKNLCVVDFCDLDVAAETSGAR